MSLAKEMKKEKMGLKNKNCKNIPKDYIKNKIYAKNIEKIMSLL